MDCFTQRAVGIADAVIGVRRLGYGKGSRRNRLRGNGQYQPGENTNYRGDARDLLVQALRRELAAAKIRIPVASVVTQTVVSASDPAMQHPTKPIGPFYSRADAEQKKRTLGWTIVEDAARGYRRVVPSPEPVEIVELDVIRELLSAGVLVVPPPTRSLWLLLPLLTVVCALSNAIPMFCGAT